jgi:hypothetical protein
MVRFWALGHQLLEVAHTHLLRAALFAIRTQPFYQVLTSIRLSPDLGIGVETQDIVDRVDALIVLIVPLDLTIKLKRWSVVSRWIGQASEFSTLQRYLIEPVVFIERLNELNICLFYIQLREPKENIGSVAGDLVLSEEFL